MGGNVGCLKAPIEPYDLATTRVLTSSETVSCCASNLLPMASTMIGVVGRPVLFLPLFPLVGRLFLFVGRPVFPCSHLFPLAPTSVFRTLTPCWCHTHRCKPDIALTEKVVELSGIGTV